MKSHFLQIFFFFYIKFSFLIKEDRLFIYSISQFKIGKRDERHSSHRPKLECECDLWMI